MSNSRWGRGHEPTCASSNTEAGGRKRTTRDGSELFRRIYRRATLVLAVKACLGVVPSAAIGQASAYVPLDDIAYTYVNALMARGMFRELSSLERPYTERALRVAIDSARTREPGPVISSYLDALYVAVEKYAVRPGNSDTTASETFRARGTGDVYATAQTSGRRELMLADSTSGVRPGGSIRLLMAGGPVVGFTRVLVDSRLNVDPEYAGRKDRKINGRTEDGYVGGHWKFGQLSFGRVARNWGPPSMDGLMLGDYAYTYDHLFGLIGNDKIHWSTVIARLDNDVPATGPEVQRYFSIHRLALASVAKRACARNGLGASPDKSSSTICRSITVATRTASNRRLTASRSQPRDCRWRAISAGTRRTRGCRTLLTTTRILMSTTRCSVSDSREDSVTTTRRDLDWISRFFRGRRSEYTSLIVGRAKEVTTLLFPRLQIMELRQECFRA